MIGCLHAPGVSTSGLDYHQRGESTTSLSLWRRRCSQSTLLVSTPKSLHLQRRTCSRFDRSNRKPITLRSSTQRVLHFSSTCIMSSLSNDGQSRQVPLFTKSNFANSPILQSRHLRHNIASHIGPSILHSSSHALHSSSPSSISRIPEIFL